MIKFVIHDNLLILNYRTKMSMRWIDSDLENKNEVELCNTFKFTEVYSKRAEVLSDGGLPNGYNFVFGILQGKYYKVNSEILSLKYPLYLSCDIEFSEKFFITYRNISIFKRINNLIDEPIYIGGDSDNAIPITEFEILIHNFPNSTETLKYAKARITNILREYLGTMSDAQNDFEKYLGKTKQIKSFPRTFSLNEFEIKKFEYIRDELNHMLGNSKVAPYSEDQWQKVVLEFILLLFPRYIKVLEKVVVKDYYTNPDKSINREIDLMLVDASGTVDIIEIKKPFDDCILTANPSYRDNYIPKRELSGTIMQLEKYLYHLSKWGIKGEEALQKKYEDELPDGLKISITNPKGFVLLGRDKDFDRRKNLDFEIIRRKYSNVVDIITYDDLLRRLDNIISMKKSKQDN